MLSRKNNSGIILLAAGGSTRLGHPKQLLQIGKELLIEKLLKTALASEFDKVTVVLGAYAAEIKEKIEDFPIEIAINEDWELGMGGSIRKGLEALEEVEYAMVLLADQYMLGSEDLNAMRTEFLKKEQDILAASYEDKKGVPAIFAKSRFKQLKSLKSQSGAGKIISDYYDNGPYQLFHLPQAAFDIDTEEDYQLALKNLNLL